MRIRRAGAIHHSRNIKISSTVWKEFKACLLGIIGELDYDTPKASFFVSNQILKGFWFLRMVQKQPNEIRSDTTLLT